MQFEHVTQIRFIVQSLVRMIVASTEEDRRSYNTGIGWGIEDLVKQQMRDLSQERSGLPAWRDLLDAAVQRSVDLLEPS